MEYYSELQKMAKDLDLTFCEYPEVHADIIFLKNFSDEQKSSLIQISRAVLYTPPNEHFGNFL